MIKLTNLLLMLGVLLAGCANILPPMRPAAITLQIDIVSTDISSSYEFAEKFRARESEFGAVMIEGGGTDSSPWLKYMISSDKVDELVDFAKDVAQSTEGIQKLTFSTISPQGVFDVIRQWAR